MASAQDDGRRSSPGGSATPRRRNPRVAVLFVLASLTVAALIWVAIPIGQGVIREFGIRDNRAEVAWRSIVPQFGDAKGCARCHSSEGDRLHSAKHDGIGCQSCHGALSEHEHHPDVGVRTPSSLVCLKCHTRIEAQPATLHTIMPAKHYIATCLACHDPHTSVAKRPPIVGHPLEDLPVCITCHGPGSFRHQSIRHPDVTRQSDASCLQCHKAGSGPGMEVTNG